MKQKNPFYIVPYMDGFYFIKSQAFRGFIGSIYNGYITFYSPLDDDEKRQIYSVMASHTRAAQKANNEKTKQPA